MKSSELPKELPNPVKSGVLHFKESGRINQDGFLPTEIYSLALDYLVITCVDVVFTFEKQVLLGKRNQYPNKGWWVIGGRMFAGENPQDAVKRKAFQEASLNLEVERFEYVNVYSTCFARRSQEPQERGLHSVNLTYKAELNKQEKEQLQLVNSEYDSWQWVELSAVAQVLDPNHEIESLLLSILQDI
ncbi:NUDIX domain-containing protein [Lyngbya aestuarii]|uniref:NUDIX domain-containing protein n=1 Tax=Lyngbya aestuarii TaxID=118322 RepID=UPI00403D59D1